TQFLATFPGHRAKSSPMRTSRMLLTSLALAGLLGTASSALATDVIVQGTTDVRDAGLLDDVIVPGFQAAYPQYTLKYIAVGTGQALTNARAGQGDAVLTPPPRRSRFPQTGATRRSRSGGRSSTRIT